jgi:membrane protein
MTWTRPVAAGSDTLDWRERLAEAWSRTVWDDTEGLSPLRRRVRTHLRALETAVRSFDADLIQLRANALTYRTLLSLVPFLAVVFSLFQAFGGLEAAERALQRRILQNLAPGAAAAVMEHVGGFLDRVSSGAVGGAGVVFLFYTVVSLLTTIEESFNALWQVEKVRSFFSRFVTYWAMMTVGPVLFALSFSITSAARSHDLVVGLTEAVPGAGWLVLVGFQFVPWLITWTGMTLLYLIVPNTQVRWRAAAGGGILAGTLWELGKLGFTWASSNLFRYDAVYGAFAALAVLLLWLQVGWLIVLTGCKIAYALQHERALVRQRTAVDLGPAEREALAVFCMIEVARTFLTGERRPTAEELAARTRVFDIQRQVLNPLIARGLLVAMTDDRPQAAAARAGDEAVESYVPGRDPSRIALKEVIDAFRHQGASVELGSDAGSAFVRRLMERLEQATESGLGDLSLAEAVRRVESGQAEPAPGRLAAVELRPPRKESP